MFEMYVRSSRRGRTLEEVMTDKILLLYLLNDANRRIGVTKVHKLTFLSERDMKLQGEKGFNFNFIKLEWGPYSSDLKKDIQELEKTGLIYSSSHMPTVQGQLILENFQQILERNQSFLSKIQNVNKKYAHVERNRLVKIVHGMINPERPWMTIHDTPHQNYILKRLKIAYENKAFHLTESEIASLEIYFEPTLFNSLKSALEEAKVKVTA